MSDQPSDAPRPNTLRESAAPNVLRQVPSDAPTTGPTESSAAGTNGAGLLVTLIVLGLAVGALFFVTAQTKNACETVDDLIANGTAETTNRLPLEWMPVRRPAGYRMESEGRLTLELVVAGRVNPDESRVELARDHFVDGYAQDWDGLYHGASFTAQRFSTSEGAQAFQAFANRFACQFAIEAFQGPRGSIGLQIRYEGGSIGEQVSWVSGDTRILVAYQQRARPADHSEIVALAAQVPNP